MHQTGRDHRNTFAGEDFDESVHDFASIYFAKNAAGLRKIKFSSFRILLRVFEPLVFAASALLTSSESPLSISSNMSQRL